MKRKPEPLLSNEHAAKLLGLTPRQLERMRNAGRGPTHTYVGRFPRYARAHVQEYLAARANGRHRGK